MRFHGHGTVSPALSAESRPVVPCSRAEAAKYSGNEVASCRPGRRTLHVLQQSLQHTRVMSPGTVTATQNTETAQRNPGCEATQKNLGTPAETKI